MSCVLNMILAFDLVFSANSVFFAIISESFIRPDATNVIIWDKAPVNPGDFYNAERGAYTASVNGYYT